MAKKKKTNQKIGKINPILYAVLYRHFKPKFTKKYHEFAWYLLNQGYDVFLFDQRCHGLSCRLTDRTDLIHVASFTHYYQDLHCFVQQIVKPATKLPLYLYAHSMGGAVAAPPGMMKNGKVF